MGERRNYKKRGRGRDYKMKNLALVAECDGNLIQVSGRERGEIYGREEREGKDGRRNLNGRTKVS